MCDITIIIAFFYRFRVVTRNFWKSQRNKNENRGDSLRLIGLSCYLLLEPTQRSVYSTHRSNCQWGRGTMFPGTWILFYLLNLIGHMIFSHHGWLSWKSKGDWKEGLRRVHCVGKGELSLFWGLKLCIFGDKVWWLIFLFIFILIIVIYISCLHNNGSSYSKGVCKYTYIYT